MIEGETRNIAFEGISICCEEPLPLDEVVNILIEPEGHKDIMVAGKVVWSDIYGIDDKDTTYGVGICFVKISDEDRASYLELVSELME
jgi:Tfp pilus assembly protein PilZ